MTNKQTLPVEVHDHFRKANLLHGYVADHLGEASKHALETGQELLAAKSSLPHGRWENECKRLFVGSARTARFYMEFARHMGALPKRQRLPILMLEGSLDGAAKAAKKAAAKPKPPKPDPDEPINVDFEPADDEPGKDVEEEPPAKPDYGKCPNCAGTKWTEDDGGVACAKCHHPHGEPAGDADEDRVTTQRQKTVKTVEALMRAFDDLQVMLAKPEHGEAIRLCKQLLKIAKGWK